MGWSNLIDRITGNTVAAADINTLMENIRTLGGNGTSAPSSDIETLNGSFDPVGTIKDWDKSNASTPALASNFKECDGSMTSDPSSPYDGERIENLNGANVALTLTWTADAGGSYATVAAADLPAITEGDDVTGAGIAASSYISDITALVITITDVSATGSIVSTFTNDGLFAGSSTASGTGKKDAIQGHYHNRNVAGDQDAVQNTSVGGANGLAAGPSAIGLYTTTGIEVTNGSDGTPRTDTSTYPSHRKYVKIKKIK